MGSSENQTPEPKSPENQQHGKSRFRKLVGLVGKLGFRSSKGDSTATVNNPKVTIIEPQPANFMALPAKRTEVAPLVAEPVIASNEATVDANIMAAVDATTRKAGATRVRKSGRRRPTRVKKPVYKLNPVQPMEDEPPKKHMSPILGGILVGSAVFGLLLTGQQLYRWFTTRRPGKKTPKKRPFAPEDSSDGDVAERM